MYSVIQHRWIRDSDQNGSNKVWGPGRFKEARGQAKSNLNSHLEMIQSHDHFPNASMIIHIDVETLQFFANWEDEHGLLYSIRYEVKEDG